MYREILFSILILTVSFSFAEKGQLMSSAEFELAVKDLKKSVLYDFDQLSLCGFAIDGEGDWNKAEMEVNTGKAGLYQGSGSLKISCNLKPGQQVRAAKFFQTVDFSAFQAIRLQVKAAKPGLRAFFYIFCDDWRYHQLPDQELPADTWTDISAYFPGMKDLHTDKINCFGVVFSAKEGYMGEAYLDMVETFGNGVYGREAARNSKSGFQKIKETKPITVDIDGNHAFGIAQPGIISYNISNPTRGDIYVSQKLKDAGPGIMRMWSFGGYGAQINFNPAEGKYEWHYLDKEIIHLRSLGWQPMLCLGECQRWNRNPLKHIPGDFGKWAVMAGETVRHYNIDLKLGLKYWEIWNEHDIGFWGSSEEEYLQLLKVACAEMKKADPSIIIFAGAWANPAMVKKVGGAMLDKVPPKGLYDGITWHNYIVSTYQSEERILTSTPLLQAPAYNAWTALRSRGLDKNMVVGMSEANICPSAITDWRQETMLAGVYWASAMYHYMIQNASLATYFTSNGDDEYGSITDRAKPSYQAILLYSKYARIVGKQWLKTSYDLTKAGSLELLGLASEKDFSIIAVNKELKGTAFDMALNLANLPPIANLQVWGIDDDHMEAASMGSIALTGNKGRYTIPPYSVRVMNGTFASPRKPAVVKVAEPTPPALGLPILGQYSWAGTPAQITRAKGPVKIDGTLDAFKHVTPIHIPQPDTAVEVRKKHNLDENFDATLRLMWDQKNFYIGVEVTQGHPPQNDKSSGQMWNGDCVELYLSSSTKLAFQSRITKSSMDYQLVVSPTSGLGRPLFNCFNGDFHDVQVASIPSKNGYTLTAAVPLSNLEGQDWASGKKVRFDVAVATAGRDGNVAHKIWWNAASDAWDSPDQWGLAELK
jgi:hypothetical protein